MDAILKILRTINPTTAGTLPEKAWNVAVMIAAIAFGVVLFACQLGIPIPGADCAVIQASRTE